MSKSDDLPEQYIPSVLREPLPKVREVAYGCGYERQKNSFGMFAGPFPTLEEALEIVPEASELGKTAKLIRFNQDGTDDVLYAWYPLMGAWKRWRLRGNRMTKMFEEFEKTYEKLADECLVDSFGGMESDRVWKEYQEAGFPEDMTKFIRESANRAPGGWS